MISREWGDAGLVSPGFVGGIHVLIDGETEAGPI